MYSQVWIVTSLIILCCVVQPARSSCYFMMAKNSDKCMHDGRVLALGSSYIDYKKCEEWSCHNDGSMSICGYGINAGVMMPPPGCDIIKGEKCAAKFVDENDHNKDCQPHPGLISISLK